MTDNTGGTKVVNGWKLYAHPCFIDQLTVLAEQVEILREKEPNLYMHKRATKKLAAIRKLILEIIPSDPERPEYRQGDTLGPTRKHWFRAKFFQQYRLFFRFHSPSHIIVYAWINDDDTLRAYRSKSDAYRTFQKMLDSGHPPETWDTLLKDAKGLE
jgi:toxin YhaV